MSELLGKAELETGVDLAGLDAGLARAERRVAIAVAAMQAMLDRLHGDVEVRVGAMEGALARISTAGGPVIQEMPGAVKVDTSRTEMWGVRGPVHPGSTTNPIVMVLEAASKTPLGSYAAAVGEADTSQVQQGDQSSGVASAADLAALTAAVSDLAHNVSPMSRLAAAGAQGLAEPSVPEAEQVQVTLSDPEAKALHDAAAALDRIERRMGSASPSPAWTAAEQGPVVAAPETRSRTTIIDSSETIIQPRSGGGGVPLAAVLEAAGVRSAAGSGISAFFGSRGAGNQTAALPVAFAWPGQGGRGGGNTIIPVALGGAGGGGGLPPVAVAPRDGGGATPVPLLAGLGWGGGALGLAGAGSLLSFAGLGVEHIITTALSIVGSAMSAAAGGGLLALGSLGKLAVGGGSDAAVMKTTLSNTSNIAKALNNLEQAQAVYGKGSQQAAVAQAQLNYQMSQLPPAAAKQELALAKAQSALSDYWQTATAPGQVQATKIAQQALGVGTVFTPLIGQAAQSNLATINQDLKPLAAWLKGPDGIGIFHDLEHLFAKDLPFAMGAFDNGVELLLRVVNLAAQDTGPFMQHLDGLLTRLNSMSNAQLGQVVNRYVDDFRLWDTFVKLLVEDIYGLFHQDVGTGNAIIGSLDGMLLRLHAYEQSARGSAQIQNIFELHKTEILDLLKLLPELAGVFGHVYLAVAPGVMTVMDDVVLPVLDGIGHAIAFIAQQSPLAADAMGLFLISLKFGGIAATVTRLQALVAWLRGTQAASAGAAAANDTLAASEGAVAAGAAAEGGAAAGGAAAAGGLSRVAATIGGGVESGGLAAGSFLAGRGLTGAGFNVAYAGSAIGAGITTAIRGAVPVIAGALASHFVLSLATHSFGIADIVAGRTNVSGQTPAGQIQLHPGGFQSSLPGFLGSAERSIVNTGLNFLGFNTGSTLSIKEVGNYAHYSVGQLDALLRILKPGIQVKVNGVPESEAQVRQLVQSVRDSKNATQSTLDAVDATISQFYRDTGRGLHALRDDFNSNMRLIAQTIGTNTDKGREAVAANVQKMIAALDKGMLDGKVGVNSGMRAIHQTLATGMQDNAITWQTDWHDMFSTLTSLYRRHKIDTATYMSGLHSIMVNGWQGIRAGVKSNLDQQISDLRAMAQKGGITWQEYHGYVHAGQVAANRQEATDMTAFADNVLAGMLAAGKASQTGTAAIIAPLNAALKALGAKPISMSIPTVVAQQVQGGVYTGAPSVIGHAIGGLVQIGTPGQSGRDTVPLNVGGMPIMVAPGEQVAVFNRHQLPIVNAALAGYGGLPGLFQAVSTPNYMAGGGLVGGGGIDAMIAEANLINSRHYPYVWGGGHNMAFSGPYDCSGSVSAVLHAAGLLGAPMVASQFMSWGLPGPGPVTVYADPSHVYMSLDGRFFGTHGSAGASWYPGSPLPGFVERHPAGFGGHGMFGAPDTIRTPKVTGSSALADIVRAGLGKTASAANRRLARAWAAATAGGQASGGDWGSFTNLSGNVVAMVRQIARQEGWGGGQVQDWLAVIQRESGGSMTALNPRSGAYGIAQFINGPGEYAQYGGNVNTLSGQLTAMAHYISQRYGDPAGALAKENAAGFYASGGLVPATRGLYGTPVGSTTVPAQLYGTPIGRPVVVPSSGLGVPGRSTSTPRIDHEMHTVARLMNLDVPRLQQLISFSQQMWPITDPHLGTTSATDFIVTQDALGNPVTPYIDYQAVAKTRGEEEQLLGWNQHIFSDLRKVAGMLNPLSERIHKTIEHRKATIRRNLASIATLRRRSTAKGVTSAQRKDLNAQIHQLEQANMRLGGDATRIGTGGDIGRMSADLTTLGQYGPTGSSTILGLTGTGGSLGQEDIAIATLNSELAATSPAALSAALAAASNTASGAAGSSAGSAQASQLLALQQQLSTQLATELATSQAQYSALAGLPSFAGGFSEGGVVPGPVGMPQMALVHGGETIRPPGGDMSGSVPEMHLHVANGMEWLKDCIRAEIQKDGRRTAVKVRRNLPSRGGGVLVAG